MKIIAISCKNYFVKVCGVYRFQNWGKKKHQAWYDAYLVLTQKSDLVEERYEKTYKKRHITMWHQNSVGYYHAFHEMTNFLVSSE